MRRSKQTAEDKHRLFGKCGVFVYQYTDQLGSTGVTRGAAAGTQLYDPYGATRYGGAGVAYQYTGQRNEASLGIYYYGARWYDPSIGRFMQADSIVPEDFCTTHSPSRIPGTPRWCNPLPISPRPSPRTLHSS